MLKSLDAKLDALEKGDEQTSVALLFCVLFEAVFPFTNAPGQAFNSVSRLNETPNTLLTLHKRDLQRKCARREDERRGGERFSGGSPLVSRSKQLWQANRIEYASSI